MEFVLLVILLLRRKALFFIPSFSDYPTFTMVRIMNATKQIIVWGGGSLDEY